MKITKFVHSCLLIENEDKTILVDPGNYSYDAHVLNITKLKHLDAIGITHEHMDHVYIPWIKEIRRKFPDVPIYTNSSVEKLLRKEAITNVITTGNAFISFTPIPHEKIWFGSPAENTMITLFDTFATVGDSLSFTKSPDILALPIQAPWGSTTWAVETAIKAKPKVIIPIHDWHWRDEAREVLYQRLRDYFAQQAIDFRTIVTGKAEIA